MYKTDKYFTPFIFIPKKFFYLSFFVISQKESWDKVQIKQTSAVNSAHTSYSEASSSQTATEHVSVVRQICCKVFSNSSEFVTVFPNCLINVNQILNDWGNGMYEKQNKHCWGRGDTSNFLNHGIFPAEGALPHTIASYRMASSWASDTNSDC